jgi:hypothetical protein
LVFFVPSETSQKWADFVVRFGPWKTLWTAATSRWDMVLLGLGFNTVNVDNAYLFLFVKMGLIGAGVLAYLAIKWGSAQWSRWTVAQRDVILFLLISGLTLDTFIIRPVVMVFIAAALPLLMPADLGVKPESESA